MRTTPWILFACALLVVWGLVDVWRGAEQRTAQALFESAKARVQASPPDFSGGLRELDLALELAREELTGAGDTAAAAQRIAAVLELRADVYRRRGAIDLALRDISELERDHRPDDLPLQVRISELEMLARDFEGCYARTHRVLERKPEWHHVRVMTGNAASALGQAQLEAARQTMQLELADEPAAQGAALLDRLATIDPSDPLRGALQHEILALFPSEEQVRAQEVCAAGLKASTHPIEAREQYARCLWTYAHPSAVSGLIDLFERAQNFNAIVDLGLAALPLAGAMTPHGLQSLALALDELGRPRAAAKIIDQTLGSQMAMPASFVPRWCQILYEAGQWAALDEQALALGRSAPGGAPGADQRSIASFYRGVANLGLGQSSAAQAQLESYTSGPMAEPFPGARAVAFQRLAEAAQRNGQVTAQRVALESALRLAPDRDPQSWRMLGELAVADGQADQAEHAFAQAIRLAPARWNELVPNWKKSGEARLLAQQRDLNVVRSNLLSEQRWFPPRGAGSWELYRLAEMHLEASAFQGAADTAAQLLQLYPNLIPGMNLLTSAYLALGRGSEAAELLLQRLELAGLDPETLGRLRRLPREQLKSAQVLRLMRFDPRFSGLLTMAHDLARQGKREQALAGLTPHLEELGSEGRILAGRLELELDRAKEAALVLEGVPADDSRYSTALRMRLEALLEAGERQKLTNLVQEIATADRLDASELLSAADALLARGESKGALVLLARLDELGGSLRSEVFLRLGLCRLLEAPLAEQVTDDEGLPTRDTRLASADFARAEAFREDGASDLGELVAAISAARWSELPSLARRARAGAASQTPLAQALLCIFEERLDEAQTRLDQGDALKDADPLWFLARTALAKLRTAPAPTRSEYSAADLQSLARLVGGTAENPRDPRLLAAALLALETRHLAAWSLAEMERLARGGRDKSLGPWPAYLAARAQAALGQSELAETRLALLQRERASFAPAWELRESLSLAHAPEGSDAWAALRAERRVALGPRAGEEAEDLLARARVQRQTGKAAQAATRLEEALRLDPELELARLELARARSDLAQRLLAVDAYASYCEAVSATRASEVVPEFLALLEAAEAAAELDASSVAARLDALALRLPRDPALALAQAQRMYASAPPDSALGVSRAFLRLEQFREATEGEPLESLRPGATRAWFDFYLAVEPARAESFVRAELEQSPGALEAWLMLGEALEAQSRPAEALEQYEAIRLMIPEPRALRRLAAITADFGTDHSKVEGHLAQIQRLEGEATDRTSLEFILARSMVNSGPAMLGQGIAMLEKLWEGNAQSPFVSRSSIGQRYATALLHRGRAEDGARAEEVLTLCLAGRSPGQTTDLLRALQGLARQLKPKT